VWKEQPQKRFRLRLMIFNGCNRARHRAHIARTHLFRPSLNGQSHTFPVGLSKETRRITLLFLAE
jgi:hypothetical protein